MSNYRYSIRMITAMIMVVCGVMIPVHAQNTFGNPMQAPISGGMSPQLQKEMAEFEKEFAALSPEEQDSFFASLDEAVKKIDDLSKTEDGKAMLAKLESGSITDEELDGLINQLVQEEPTKKVEKPAPVKKEEKKPEAPKQVLTSEHEKAINAINSLISHTHSFIVKAASAPEFSSKVNVWKRKKLVALEGSKTWNILKTDIEQFVEKLSRLLERDPKTTEYYHIDALLKNESVLNNLYKVERTIAEIEPRAEEVPLLGEKRMKSASKKAYQSLLNEYNEALYILNSTNELKKLFALFDPVAKKYREAEEKAVKQADRAKGSVYTGASGRYTPSEHEEYGDYGSSDYGSSPAYTAPSTYIPSARSGQYGSQAAAFTDEKESQRAGQKGGKSSAKGKKDDLGKEAAGDEKKKDESVKIPQEVKKLQKEIDDSVKKIEGKLKEAASLISENKMIDKVSTVFIDASPVDFSIAVELIPDLNKTLSMQKGILGDLHQLHRKLKAASTRQSVQKRLKKLYDKYKKELDGLYDALLKTEQEWQANAQHISLEKQYAYFGKEDVAAQEPIEKEVQELVPEKPLDIQVKKEQLDQMKSRIVAPYSLLDIKNGLEKVRAAIDGFAQAKLAEDEKK